jgi:glycosyltransferase involved in cell wall biosynthesis
LTNSVLISDINFEEIQSLQLAKKPKVTIVTPAYNQGEYLESTMRSVLAQDYVDLEYIVIDDGSSDDSLTVAKRIAAEYPGRVTVLSQPNSGQAATLNIGWEVAKGEILAYLSSDDCLVPHAVSRMVTMLDENPSASVVYCDFWLIDAEGRRLKMMHTENFSSKRLCIDLVCQPGPGAFFRRAVFDQTGGWNPKLRQVPDFEFWLRALRFGPFVRVAESLAEYRIHEGSASFRVMPIDRAEEIVRVVTEYWMDHSEDSGRNLAMAKALNLAAKNHAQSGRIGFAFSNFFKAIKEYPKIIFDVLVWRQLVVGILRRKWYQIQSRRRIN